jgi:rhodanese-related sulfurtransferase
MEVVSIRPRDLEALRAGGRSVELIDVRTPVEFREIHVPFARNVPLSDFDAATIARQRADRAEEPLYLICRSGMRGKQACEKLLTAGTVKAINVEGGTLAWAEGGLPVVRGKKAVTVERQVRIAIGFLVILGTLLAWLAHPGFFALTTFVGLGVLYAGVTDTCAMGLLLARMPWNRLASMPESTNGHSCASSQSPVSVG